MSKKEDNKKKCTKCQTRKHRTREFYLSNSSNHSDSRYPVCKTCIIEDIANEEDLLSEETIKKVQDILLEMNRPYIHEVWLSSVEEASNRGLEVFGTLMKNLNLNHRKKNWRDSVFEDVGVSNEFINKETESKNINKKRPKKKLDIELDTQNEKDVLRLLGYDPFDYESEGDRANLFNKLIDYLDESTLEDGFKLTSVIEIVRTFNQIDKINAAITRAFEGSVEDTKGINSLVNAKDKMHKSVLDIAKENGLSEKHATNKSKGAGTLSGILKQLQEHDIHEAEVNLFDINTAEGIKQVADLSNRSIMQQLQFDENDYSEMLLEQRELLQDNIDKADRFEEENRKLRAELIERDKIEKDLNEKIIELKKEISLLEG